jgi:hypothetical protein
MLKNTFLHIPGIGSITEQNLWNSGITDWDTPFDNTPCSGHRELGKFDGDCIQYEIKGDALLS